MRKFFQRVAVHFYSNFLLISLQEIRRELGSKENILLLVHLKIKKLVNSNHTCSPSQASRLNKVMGGLPAFKLDIFLLDCQLNST